MSARQPYFLVQRRRSVIPGRTYWLVDFRGTNNKNVFNGQRWHSRRAALDAIALIDPSRIHPVKWVAR